MAAVRRLGKTNDGFGEKDPSGGGRTREGVYEIDRTRSLHVMIDFSKISSKSLHPQTETNMNALRKRNTIEFEPRRT